MDSAFVYGDRIAEALRDGERLDGAFMVAYMAGEERMGLPDPGPSFDLVNGLDVPAWNAAAERLVAGVSLVGAPGTLAHSAKGAFSGGEADHLLITGERIAAAHVDGQRASLVWEAPRAALLGARRSPRLLQRGRVTLAWSDGSLLRLVAGMVFTREAHRLVALLG
ncbi:hypothetical protein G7085_16780 [Tessaracoccus sp. HDW20]|uniref:hypothetical protein n=1 Tax=Tessaracoccus coleopterorum TaxID=2714950 RepID=UPI0018D39FEE|nr:hypothetical protein [Tessaracoccus coleopterorum]NHB85697.1 hypothetical protein [Tessaracoccus coleopterorum]